MRTRERGDVHLLSRAQAGTHSFEHVNSDFSDCSSRLLGKVPLRKEVSAVRYAYDEVDGFEAEYTDINDAHGHSFNDDWLPEWRLLKDALNNEYKRLYSLKASA